MPKNHIATQMFTMQQISNILANRLCREHAPSSKIEDYDYKAHFVYRSSPEGMVIDGMNVEIYLRGEV